MKLAPRLVILHYYTAWLMEFGFEKEDTYMRGSVIDYEEYSRGVNDCIASKGIQGDVGYE